MKKESHPLACQRSGRWHLFSRFCKPHRQTWNKSRTQNQSSHFGLKAAAEFARSEWKPGWRGRAFQEVVLRNRSCSLLKCGVGRHPKVSVLWLLPPRASAASWPLSFLCTDQPWPRTVHMKRCGDTTNSREMGMVTPNGCCFPQSNPPLLIFPKPLSQFAHWNSVDHYSKEMRDTSAV